MNSISDQLSIWSVQCLIHVDELIVVQQNQSISEMELTETDRGMYWQPCSKWWSITKIRMILKFHTLVSNICSWNNKHEFPFYDLNQHSMCDPQWRELTSRIFGLTYWKYYAISYRNMQLLHYVEIIAYDYPYVSQSDAMSWQYKTLMQKTWQSSINLLGRYLNACYFQLIWFNVDSV